MIEELKDIAREAGELILEIYEDENLDWQVDKKADNSPLTIADQKANDLICQRLEAQFPEISIISEENKNVHYETRRTWQRFFLVDPLDGTKEFIKRNGEFTVNIALVEGGKPVAGVVYAPVLDLMYAAEQGKGAWKTTKDGEQPIRVQEFSEEQPNLSVVCSRSHLNAETEQFISRYKDCTPVSMGSSLKFMLIAEGKAAVYPRIAPTMEWDTGAAQAVVEEAGGEVLEFETGEPLRYNKEVLLNPYFVVYGKREAVKQ